MLNLSFLSGRHTDFLRYFGSLFVIFVLGRKKCTFMRILVVFRATLCFNPLATFEAFLEPPLAGAAASPSLTSFFGAISNNCCLCGMLRKPVVGCCLSLEPK